MARKLGAGTARCYNWSMENQRTERPVRLLPEEVANQIAAGEVVERPASVLKELMENSLDAGAGRIGVEIEAAGRRLIKVVDDGCGMGPDDVLMALERHATSKVASAGDLAAVSTLGFRGEALPSIAAVSRMTLRSRRRDHESGSQVFINGGSLRSVEEVGCPAGTLVEVRSLFFNTPARRKFLKSAATENAHLAEVLIRLALARPEVAFRYSNGGRLVYDLPASQDPKVRVASLLGRQTAAQMQAIEQESGPLRISGLCGLPSVSRTGYDQVYTMVNGRFVRDKVLLHAAGEAYRDWLPTGRRPILVLGIELDPAMVDVNVHPAKTEVRFRESRQVHDALVEGIRRGLQSAMTPPAERRPPASPGRTAPTPPQRPDSPPPWGGELSPARAAQDMPRSAPWAAPQPAPQPDPSQAPAVAPRRPAITSLPPSEAPAGPSPAKALFTPVGEIGVIGQLHGLYILCSTPQGLVIIDQHAAHERLSYEELKQGLKDGGMPSQGFLAPITLELSPSESAWAGEQAPDWARLGLHLQPFGGNTWLIEAVPPLLAGKDPGPVVRDLLSELASSGVSAATPEFLELALRTMACHSSIRSGQRLGRGQMEHLINRLMKLPQPLTCPHGRPIMLLISARELARQFKRGSEPGRS